MNIRAPSSGDRSLGNLVGWTVFFAVLVCLEASFVLGRGVYQRGYFGLLSANWWGFELSLSRREFAVPFWTPLVVTGAVFAALVARDARTVYRWRRGLCLSCGYDVSDGARGAGQCPECGRDPLE